MGERIGPGLKALLADGKLRRAQITRKMVLKEFDGAKKDLETSLKSLREENYKWATVQGYYSIFHAARALLYNQGFREKSHRGLLAAVRILYPKQLSTSTLEDFSEAMRLREEADYGLVYSEDSAKDVLESAETFLEECKTILNQAQSNTTRRRKRKSARISKLTSQ